MAFEVIRSYRRGLNSKVPRIVLGKTGVLQINRIAADQTGLQRGQAVRFWLDAESGAIALRHCEPEDDGALKVRGQSGSGGVAIAASTLCRVAFGRHPSEPMYLRAEQSGEFWILHQCAEEDMRVEKETDPAPAK